VVLYEVAKLGQPLPCKMSHMEHKLTAMLSKHMLDLHDAIEDSYGKRRYMPCLVLLYSAIDVAASLEPSSGSGVGDRFRKWVDRYMPVNGSLNCSAVDLYAARCALIHTYTPQSDLSQAGKAQVIAYAFGPAALEKLNNASTLAAQNRQLNIHARTLIDAFYEGFGIYLTEIEADKSRLVEVEQSASLWMVSIDSNVIDNYLEISKLMNTANPNTVDERD
jgi:hypothetical protein